MFWVQLYNGTRQKMSEYELQEFCWNWGVDFGLVKEAVGSGKMVCNMIVDPA